MVAFDNTVLSLLIFPDADLRQGGSGQKVEYARERVLGLVQEIEDAREQVAVPAPAGAGCGGCSGLGGVLQTMAGPLVTVQ
jgi:hypothetical protein